jgi:hypothetical protein
MQGPAVIAQQPGSKGLVKDRISALTRKAVTASTWLHSKSSAATKASRILRVVEQATAA